MSIFSPLLATGLFLFSLTAQAQSPAQAQDKNQIKEEGPKGLPAPMRIVCAQQPLSDQPLCIVNGVPMASSFKPEDVPVAYTKEVKVLKDVSATAIYGSRAANGVVLITTKRRWKPASK